MMGLIEWFRGDDEIPLSEFFHDLEFAFDEEMTLTVESPELEQEAERFADLVHSQLGVDRKIPLMTARTVIRQHFASELSRQFQLKGIPIELSPADVRSHSPLASVSMDLPHDPNQPITPEAFNRAVGAAIYNASKLAQEEGPNMFVRFARQENRVAAAALADGPPKGPKRLTAEEWAELYGREMDERRNRGLSEAELSDPSETSFIVRVVATAAFVTALAATVPSGIAMAGAVLAPTLLAPLGLDLGLGLERDDDKL